jgi:hypothetical protein
MGLSLGSSPRIPFSTGLDANKSANPLTGDLFYATDTAINYQWDGATWQSNENLVPIGAIIAWHKSFTNTPAIPNNYLECNGQVVSDASSVYNGQTLPDLNTAGNEKFLRGNAASGTIAGTTQHLHQVSSQSGSGGNPSFNSGNAGYYLSNGSFANGNISNVNGYSTLTTHTPIHMTVVWIMRIK